MTDIDERGTLFKTILEEVLKQPGKRPSLYTTLPITVFDVRNGNVNTKSVVNYNRGRRYGGLEVRSQGSDKHGDDHFFECTISLSLEVG